MLAQYRQQVVEFIKPFTLWQKLYFSAFFLLLFQLVFSSDAADLSFIGLLALIAMAIEVWPKFLVLWENIVGRVLIVTTYVVVVNFAVAFAGHQLNEVVGIEPSNLIYATGFVSVLMAPIWIISITLLGMLTYVVIKYLWFLFILLPWLVGLYERPKPRAIKFAKTTRLVRMIMLPVMFMALISLLESYGNYQKDGFLGAMVESVHVGSATDKPDVAEALKEVETELTKVYQQELSELSEQNGSVNVASLEQSPAEPPTEPSSEPNAAQEVSVDAPSITVNQQEFNISKVPTMEKAIAAFVYYVEAFAYSQCEMSDQERVLAIGEYDILAVKPDDSELGYSFSVRPCKLKDYTK